MSSETNHDNRHCWFCLHTQPGEYSNDVKEWRCFDCGTVEDLSEWPTPVPDGFKRSVDAMLNDLEFIDRLGVHLLSPIWREPLANPKPLTELHSADLHDGYYPILDDDEPEDHR
jgi:hypothetical protein